MRCQALLCSIFVVAAALPAGTAAEPPPLLAPLADGEALPLVAVDPAIPLAGRLPRLSARRPLHALSRGARLPRRARRGLPPRDHVELWGVLRASAAAAGGDLVGRQHRAPRGAAERSSPASTARERLTDEARGQLLRDMPAVVWLAYGVHGNESSSTEAAMGRPRICWPAARRGRARPRPHRRAHRPAGQPRRPRTLRELLPATPRARCQRRSALARARRALAGRPWQPLLRRPQPRLGVGDAARDPRPARRG